MKLRFSPEAQADIRRLHSYISTTLGNPTAAHRIEEDIFRMCIELKQFPLLGMELSAKTGLETNLRYLICDKQIVFYRVEGEFLSIIRILDGRSDYLRILFEGKRF